MGPYGEPGAGRRVACPPWVTGGPDGSGGPLSVGNGLAPGSLGVDFLPPGGSTLPPRGIPRPGLRSGRSQRLIATRASYTWSHPRRPGCRSCWPSGWTNEQARKARIGAPLMDTKTNHAKRGDGRAEPTSPGRPASCRTGRLATASRVGIAAVVLWACAVGGGVAAASGPVTTLAGGPTGTVTANIASFSFSSKWRTATFHCQLDTAGTCRARRRSRTRAADWSTHVQRVRHDVLGCRRRACEADLDGRVSRHAPSDWRIADLEWRSVDRQPLAVRYIQACAGPTPPQGVTLVNSPVHPGWQHSMQFTISDQSVSANCPILGSPGIPTRMRSHQRCSRPAKTIYIGFWDLLPAGLPEHLLAMGDRLLHAGGRALRPAVPRPSPVSIMAIQQSSSWGPHTQAPSGTAPTPYHGTTLGGPRAPHQLLDRPDHRLRGALSTTASCRPSTTARHGTTKRRWSRASTGTEPTRTTSISISTGELPSLGLTTLYHTGIKVATSYAAAAPYASN